MSDEIELEHPEKDSSKSNIVLEREAEAKAKPAASGASGALPDDFPGRSALSDAGVNTYGQLRKVDDLTTLAGIGPSTAANITAALDAADRGA